jgi:hypothetical protein
MISYTVGLNIGHDFEPVARFSVANKKHGAVNTFFYCGAVNTISTKTKVQQQK